VHSGPASIDSGSTPARASSSALARLRSTRGFAAPAGGATMTPAARASGTPASNAATTSGPTSKQHGPIAGPSATRRSAARAP
jgi:hypothetical protein